MVPLRIRAVDGADEKGEAILRYLQLETLPYDTPCETHEGWWWVAFDGGLPVAFAGLKCSLSIPGGGYLCRAGVLPSHRGRGLQGRLLASRERMARKLGMGALVSDTFDNPHSTNNLIKAGFRAFDPPHPYGATGTNYWRKPL
jgi:GNAT superfamily N-acetyltransferase